MAEPENRNFEKKWNKSVTNITKKVCVLFSANEAVPHVMLTHPMGTLFHLYFELNTESIHHFHIQFQIKIFIVYIF